NLKAGWRLGQSESFSIFSKIWMGGYYKEQYWVTDVEKVPPFEVGQEIHVMQSVSQPRLGWSNESPATVGKIVRIDMDGALNTGPKQ
ncbi:E3 ubiquitin-protein ligase KEG-like, partial [Trifolium medium]|nr:E3 ubiquitin-protein ligase KEG-like [Trifolium medium]